VGGFSSRFFFRCHSKIQLKLSNQILSILLGDQRLSQMEFGTPG
jgi:hypothetical protein